MQHTPGGISQPNLRLPTALLLQKLAHARKRSTRTRSAGESVQIPLSLFPDLRTRSFVVCPGVGDVIELIRPHSIGEVFGKGFRLVVVVFGFSYATAGTG
jgi:hypothetical protein